MYVLLMERLLYDKCYCRVVAWLLGWHPCDSAEVSIIYLHQSIFLVSNTVACSNVTAFLSDRRTLREMLFITAANLSLRLAWFVNDNIYFKESCFALLLESWFCDHTKYNEMPRRWSELSLPKMQLKWFRSPKKCTHKYALYVLLKTFNHWLRM